MAPASQTAPTESATSGGIALAPVFQPLRFLYRQQPDPTKEKSKPRDGSIDAMAELEPLLPMASWICIGRARTSTGHDTLAMVAVNEADVPPDILARQKTEGRAVFSALVGGT